ncbi:uncharacterized protein LOC128247061 [Octopus bimaculoides]|uniref:uncharacterized protein LOC128247061 n=1 Tax=Octopus bimaculoides TaxID=37653 RepID=UPI0022E02B9D|nr:uncharacterized protein LOC128247061 [Octopus bimaculoides]
MRALLHGDQCAEQFSTGHLQLGNEKVPFDGNSDINLAHIAIMVNSPAEMKNRVLPDLSNNYNSYKRLCERAILASKYETVARINHELMNKIPIVFKEYKLVDSVLDENQDVHYPTEFLNSLETPGPHPHKLFLKVGVLIMLVINFDPPKLCNGTRLTVKTLSPNVIEATIITGCASGEEAFVPRIPIKPTDMPFEFKRTQFPVRLCFAMSINNAEGQAFKFTGLHLIEPCFSHGQLYVRCSKTRSRPGQDQVKTRSRRLMAETDAVDDQDVLFASSCSLRFTMRCCSSFPLR